VPGSGGLLAGGRPSQPDALPSFSLPIDLVAGGLQQLPDAGERAPVPRALQGGQLGRVRLDQFVSLHLARPDRDASERDHGLPAGRVCVVDDRLERLDQIAEILHVERLQAAGLILERILEQIQEEDDQ